VIADDGEYRHRAEHVEVMHGQAGHGAYDRAADRGAQ
jgi:hypothetical protein